MNEIQQEEVVIRTDIKAGDGSQMGTGNAAGNGQLGSGGFVGNGQIGTGN